MMSSRTPGDLGVYGFRNRSDHSYDGLFIANGTAIKEPRLWDLAARGGKRWIVLGVPGTYPPRPLNGVDGDLLPHSRRSSRQYTYPPSCADEIEQVVGEYLFDTEDFRTDNKDWLLEQIYEMTRTPVRARRAPARDQAVGPLRDGRDGHRPDPPRLLEGHGPGAPEARAGRPVRARDPDYHVYLDGLLGELLAHATTTRPCSSSPITAPSGWTAASASTSGCAERAAGDAARAAGADAPGETSDRLVADDAPGATAATTAGSSSTFAAASPRARRRRRTTSACATTSSAGSRRSPTTRATRSARRAYKPEELYRAGRRRRARPDRPLRRPSLARRRTIGGEEGIHTFENDTGPDDANHAQDGLLIMAGPGSSRARVRTCTYSTWRRPSWSCSASTYPPACAAGACSAPPRLRDVDRDGLARRGREPGSCARSDGAARGVETAP